jgi:branched-chain amino acid transport system permease protein
VTGAEEARPAPAPPPSPATLKRSLSELLGWSPTPLVPTLVVVAVAALIPLVWRNDYIISLLTLIFLYCLMTQSWNLTIGMCGIWNFGQLAIIAIGGYTMGILATDLGLSPWLSLPVGAVAAMGAALVMVLPSIRLRGIYASMLTFAFAEVVRLLIIADNSGLTGGPFGLQGVPSLFARLSPLGELWAHYWMALGLTAAVMLLIHRLMNSPVGMGLVGLRESIRYSIGMGINRRMQVILATALSGLIAGVAGGLYTSYYGAMAPTVMGLGPMGLLVTMVVVGGLGTVRGPIVGTFTVMILSELLRDVGMWRLVVLGALLLLVLAFQPTGLDGLIARQVNRLRTWMNEEQRGAEQTAQDQVPAEAEEATKIDG